MRIRSIHIQSWRNFENIRLDLDSDTSLVCLVGANGTGKSHILELIAACAHKVGLSQGIDIARGDPFADEHEYSVVFQIAEGTNEAIDPGLQSTPYYAQWDRTITILSSKSDRAQTFVIQAGGIADQNQASQFAMRLIGAIRESQDVHFVSLDADRAYPKKDININELAQAYETQWDNAEFTKGRSFRATRHLYDEWIKYLLAQENQAGSRLMQGIRRAREAATAEPEFIDHFEKYKQAVREVLPHLLFVGVDTRTRSLLFDTTGMQLTFDKLSGGEREIAFLIGQIDRFQLRRGLFLLDEPELHLNADLIRTWVSYLIGTVETGQVWLATHSLEAVEAAGQEATFLFEKNSSTKTVDTVARLNERPVLSALSRSVGTPAFSLSQLRFLFVEGEDSLGERETFKNLTQSGSETRFLPCGSCNEVTRRLSAMRALSTEAHEAIRIGGIIDRDFRLAADLERLSHDNNLFALPVLEVENFFLHPPTIDHLIEQNGVTDLIASSVIKEHSDNRAGAWIYQHAYATPNARSLPETLAAAKRVAKGFRWADFEEDRDAKLNEICAASALHEDDRRRLRHILEISASAYERIRDGADLWKECEGKEVLNAITSQVGYVNAPVLMQAAYAAWARETPLVSEELQALRQYIEAL